jgi:hypothetical protein
VELKRKCSWCGLAVYMTTNREGLDVARQPNEAFPIKTEPTRYLVEGLRCPHCGGITIVMLGQYPTKTGGIGSREDDLYPRVHGMPAVQPEVPEHYAKDYDEACAVLPISPQCSAMLARRLLQALLLGPGGVEDRGRGDDLAKQIERATGLPSDIEEHLHLLRTMGNFGAHQQLDVNTAVVLDVDRDDAELALKLIHELFDHYFTRPARMQARKAQWNKTKQQPAGKPPVK